VDANDVGDPFILSVPAGVAPPTDVPFIGSGPDSYQSSPWSAATAAAADAHGWYVLFGTTDWQENVPTAISTDLVHWTQAPDALPDLPGWAKPSISMTWAPAALATSAGWVLFFSTEEAASKRECIGAAVASSPAGPYVDRSAEPMICQRSLGGSIDPSVIRAVGGAEYLVWKNNGNANATPDSIWAQQLSPDGLSLLGQPRRLISTDAAWEHGIVEAPAMVAASSGGYWLFYAGGDWNSNRYGTGLAFCVTVTGPCAETSSRPFLGTTKSVISPGGLDTVRAHNGQLWAAFTALVLVPSPWQPGRDYYNRVLDIAPVLSH
jgi:beta-xylosidase